MYVVEIAQTFHTFTSKREAYLWAQEMSSRGWGTVQVYHKEPTTVCMYCHTETNDDILCEACWQQYIESEMAKAYCPITGADMGSK